MLRTVQFVVGLLLLIAIEILRVYFIMPFPGSQKSETIELAYFIHTNIFYLRTIGLLLIIFPVIQYFLHGKRWTKALVIISLGVYGYIFYLFNYKFLADKMFKQPGRKVFVLATTNTIDVAQPVLGVSMNGEAKAYPIKLIGYHHQVRDTVGGVDLMITYCTVCRTGRVFKPEVNGKRETFRLVGMDHFNAMFEDATTGTWWRQVNGEAVVGPLKGSVLEEIEASQMSLRAWLDEYPDSKIMQPDTIFNKRYEELDQYGSGKIKDSDLIKKDSLSWNDKSWVVGVVIGNTARAYDWEELMKVRVVNDTLAGVPLFIALENDSTSFHVWKRDSLVFSLSPDSVLIDEETKSTWSWQGRATSGALVGARLTPLQSYQEYWHSWRTFRPQTTQYRIKPE